MTVAFRNVTARSSDPVARWPTEAVQTALERGGLPEWRRIADEIVQAPWGRTARQVEEVLGHSRPYGVAELFTRVIGSARAQAEAREREAVATELRELAARSGLTQAEFARRLGTSGSRFSSYVNRAVVPSATLMVRARSAGVSDPPPARARRRTLTGSESRPGLPPSAAT